MKRVSSPPPRSQSEFPRPPPGRWRWLKWLLFAVSVLLLFAGMSAPHGPVLAAGLVLSGLSEGWLTK